MPSSGDEWPPERYCTECMWAPDPPQVPSIYVITSAEGDRFACEQHAAGYPKVTMKEFWLTVADGLMKEGRR